MKPLANLIGALSFNDATSEHGTWLRKLYFAVAYNTALPINAMVALGSITPYLFYLMITGQLTASRYVVTVIITLLSAFSYGLIYVVNDYIDRRKDVLQAIPKQSARHVLGRYYLLEVAVVHLTLITVGSLVWSQLLLPLISYDILLIVMSVVHSYAGKAKALTIFVERFCKFCAAYGLIYLVTLDPVVKVMMLSALIVYPLGFTLDYAYRGYLRDRLKINTRWRFGLYACYWTIVAIIAVIFQTRVVAIPVLTYVVTYYALIVFTAGLARVLPYNFLNGRYNDHVAGEKRRLLTYGGLQLVVVLLGGLYVIFR